MHDLGVALFDRNRCSLGLRWLLLDSTAFLFISAKHLVEEGLLFVSEIDVHVVPISLVVAC